MTDYIDRAIRYYLFADEVVPDQIKAVILGTLAMVLMPTDEEFNKYLGSVDEDYAEVLKGMMIAVKVEEDFEALIRARLETETLS